jgi:hypothetical protein
MKQFRNMPAYYVWCEAMYGKLTGDWTGYNKAWNINRAYYIPSDKDQPNLGDYDPSKCAAFVPGGACQMIYPLPMNLNAPTVRMVFMQHSSPHTVTDSMYLMHWILDVDNGTNTVTMVTETSRVSQINTFQRGEQEYMLGNCSIPMLGNI